MVYNTHLGKNTLCLLSKHLIEDVVKLKGKIKLVKLTRVYQTLEYHMV
jgi:hypothetical protein